MMHEITLIGHAHLSLPLFGSSACLIQDPLVSHTYCRIVTKALLMRNNILAAGNAHQEESDITLLCSRVCTETTVL
jgi:hypothetical protein